MKIKVRNMTTGTITVFHRAVYPGQVMEVSQAQLEQLYERYPGAFQEIVKGCPGEAEAEKAAKAFAEVMLEPEPADEPLVEIAEEKPVAYTLTDVKGIGSKIAGRLKEAGVPTLETLAVLGEEDVDAVAEKSGLSRDDLANWVAQAQELLGGMRWRVGEGIGA